MSVAVTTADFARTASEEAQDLRDEAAWEQHILSGDAEREAMSVECGRFVSPSEIAPSTDLDHEGEWWDEQADRAHEAMRESIWFRN